MEANELRINNYYELKGSVLDGGICQLKNLNDFIHIGNLIKNDLVKPIPLTEEWLLKFDKIEWISKDVGGIFYWFNGEKKYLKFVHLLQNTYFCIEQKELLCVNI